MKSVVIVLLFCILWDSTNGFFLNTRSRKSKSNYGPPKPYTPPKVLYKAPVKITYDSPEVETNEIDDGYGSPAAPLISAQAGVTYEEPLQVYKEPSKKVYRPPMKMRYKMRPSMHRMKSFRKGKMRKPSYMMYPSFPKMPRYKFPKMRLPKFMLRMPKFPKFPRMQFPRYKPSRPMYHSKPVHSSRPVVEMEHGGYKHMDNLDYSGWTPIGMKNPEPSYNAVDESPIVTIEDAYKSPYSEPLPPLPSGDGYGAPELITATPAAADTYGSPQADPIAPQPAYEQPSYGTPAAPLVTYKEAEPAPIPSYTQPAGDNYGKPAAEPISAPQVTYAKPAAPVPAYKEPELAYRQPEPAYKEPVQETYGEPQAPLVTYKEPETNQYDAPQPPPAPAYSPEPLYNTPAPLFYQYSQPTLAPQTTYAQPSYGGYISPIEEPLFQYAPVSDLNSLAAVAAEDTYSAAAAPPSPGRYQATDDASALAEEVQSGSVYVQPNTVYSYQQPQSISYPSYGEKVPTSNQYGGQTEPLFYQSPSYSQTSYASPAYAGTGGKSTASFSIHVGGVEHGHSHQVDHKV